MKKMSNLIGKNLSISTETSDYTQSTENDHFMSGLNLDPLILLNEIYDDTTDNSFISGGFTLTSSGVDSIPNGMAMSHLLPFKHIPHRDPYKEREKMSHHCPINSIVTGYPKYTKEAIIIISQIGAGSTSHVYKCIYMPTLSLVALKTIKASSQSQKTIIEVELKTLFSIQGKVIDLPKEDTYNICKDLPVLSTMETINFPQKKRTMREDKGAQEMKGDILAPSTKEESNTTKEERTIRDDKGIAEIKDEILTSRGMEESNSANDERMIRNHKGIEETKEQRNFTREERVMRNNRGIEEIRDEIPVPSTNEKMNLTREERRDEGIEEKKDEIPVPFMKVESYSTQPDILDLDQIESNLRGHETVMICNESTESRVVTILDAINYKKDGDTVDLSDKNNQSDAHCAFRLDSVTMKDSMDENSLRYSDYLLRLYDAYTTSDERSVCLLFEYMGGGSLMNLINSKYPVSENNIAVVAYSVLRALNELNLHNTIHRDVKPQNILCKQDGTVKLADFGISRELNIEGSNPMTFTGSLSYMSPERIRGESYTSNCDIWSLGMCLLCFFKGLTQIYKSMGYWGMLDSLQRDPPNLEQRGTANFSQELNQFIDMCLERDFKLRPNATEMLRSPFIMKAIFSGVINPSIPPKLQGISDVSKSRSDFDLKSVMSSILTWQPEHIDDMVFLQPHISLDPIIIPTSISAQRAIQEQEKDGTDRQHKKIFSRKAINHLALELNVHPDEILEIIIANHIKESLNIKSKAKVKRKVSKRACNPLFPYEYSFNYEE